MSEELATVIVRVEKHLTTVCSVRSEDAQTLLLSGCDAGGRDREDNFKNLNPADVRRNDALNSDMRPVGR